MIINLHGLNSAGNNTAARYLKACHVFSVLSPTYTVHNFKKGIEALKKSIDFDVKPLVFVASSTGALFAESLASKYDGHVILINPVVDACQLKQFIGFNTNFKTGVKYEFTQFDIDSFPKNDLNSKVSRLVFIETDDDVLDHHLTIEHYKNFTEIIQFDGKNHRFSHWESIMPDIIKFYQGLES